MFHVTLPFSSVLYVSTEYFNVKLWLVKDTSNIYQASIPINNYVLFSIFNDTLFE